MSILALPEESAYPGLLNRAEARRAVETHIAEIPRLLAELVDYGTLLIPRCLSDQTRELVDLIAVAVFLKQGVEMLDGAQILLDQAAVRPATLQLRALFEVSVYLDWLLAADSSERATAYYTWNLRRKRTWMLRAIPGRAEHREMETDLAGLGPLIETNRDEVAREAERQLIAVNDLLSGPDYSAMNARFDAGRGGRMYDPAWYSIFFPGPRRATLRNLVKSVGRTGEYRLIYELGSESMHSSRSDVHIQVLKSSVRLRHLRDLTDVGLVAQLIAGQAIHMFGVALDRYRPSERENFARKYAERWREAYLRQRSVRYEYVDRPTF
jgi:Family of unknown function (DUF5677)